MAGTTEYNFIAIQNKRLFLISNPATNHKPYSPKVGESLQIIRVSKKETISLSLGNSSTAAFENFSGARWGWALAIHLARHSVL